MGEATTLLREFDFREADILEQLLVLQIDQAVIDKGMSDAAERFLTILPADDGIRAGDIVRISFPDETAENGARQEQFSVGRYFFDRQLEDVLLGMVRGQTAELDVKGRQKPVTVLSVKRRHIPLLTDQIIARLGIEGVGTVEGYRQHLIDRAAKRMRSQRDRVLTEFAEKQVLAQSEFVPMDRDAEEYRAWCEEQWDQARQIAGQNEDVSTAEVLRQMLRQGPQAGEEEVLSALAQECEKQMKLRAIGRAHAARDGVSFTVADCEADLRKFAEMRGVPYEAVAEQFRPESLLPGKYIEYYENKILAYYEEQYTVTVTTQHTTK